MSDPPRLLPIIQPDTGNGSPPLFDKVAIVGLGLIGGSIALAVRQQWPSALVIGVDRKEVLEKAMILHAIDVAADDPVVMAEADLVVLAAPIDQNINMLAELDQHVTTHAVVTDVGSTKRSTVEAAQQLPARLTFIGGHPLGGAPRVEASVKRLCGFATALGAEPHVMAPDEHDRLLALVSHLPQLTASALMHIVGTGAGERGLALTGRGLFDSTRLASSPADIWREICRSNSDAIGDALDLLIEELRVLRHDLASGQELERVFESAGDWRDRLAKVRPPRRNA